MSGTQDVVIAGGVQTMTQIPISSAMVCAKPLGFADPFSGSKGWVARFGDQPVSQFTGAQMIADKWGISRDDMEAFALESHRRARVAQDRKSVVSGKSVSVRVDLGGCRIIQK